MYIKTVLDTLYLVPHYHEIRQIVFICKTVFITLDFLLYNYFNLVFLDFIRLLLLYVIHSLLINIKGNFTKESLSPHYHEIREIVFICKTVFIKLDFLLYNYFNLVFLDFIRLLLKVLYIVSYYLSNS